MYIMFLNSNCFGAESVNCFHFKFTFVRSSDELAAEDVHVAVTSAD